MKLAHLMLLHGILLSRDAVFKNIDLDYIHLADDLSSFDSYLWGLVAYYFFVTNLIVSRGMMMEALRMHNKPKFNVYGFAFFLQVWVYEVFLNVGLYCASQMSYAAMGKRHPRILRWKVPNFFRYNNLLQFFQPGNSSFYVG